MIIVNRLPVEQNNCLLLFNLMFFSSLKFSHCQVTSQEAPWIEKPSDSSLLPGQNELVTVILFYIFISVCFVLLRRINCFLSI